MMLFSVKSRDSGLGNHVRPIQYVRSDTAIITQKEQENQTSDESSQVVKSP